MNTIEEFKKLLNSKMLMAEISIYSHGSSSLLIIKEYGDFSDILLMVDGGISEYMNFIIKNELAVDKIIDEGERRTISIKELKKLNNKR